MGIFFILLRKLWREKQCTVNVLDFYHYCKITLNKYTIYILYGLLRRSLKTRIPWELWVIWPPKWVTFEENDSTWYSVQHNWILMPVGSVCMFCVQIKHEPKSLKLRTWKSFSWPFSFGMKTVKTFEFPALLVIVLKTLT